MNKLFFAICIITFGNLLVFAQNTDDYNKNEFFVGFTRQGIINDENHNGFEVAYTRNVNRYFGIKGDVSATFVRKSRNFTNPPPSFIDSSTRTRKSIANFLAGVQVKDNASKKRFKPFAHALIGVGRISQRFTSTCEGNCIPSGTIISTNKDTALAAAFGGGLDIKLTKKIDLRAIQIDYNPIFTNRKREDTARFSIGIVFK